jgi:hypothetical protein
MKLIRNIIYLIIIIIAVYMLYTNRDKLVTYFEYLFKNSNDIIIEKSNEYKRNYNYLKFSNNEDFIPENRNDILNIYYNVINNGWENFTFYCPKEYKECLDDINEISNNTTILSNINGYVSPYNSFETLDTTSTSLGEITIRLTKNYSAEEITMINSKIDELIISLNLTNKTPREIITIVHDYVINNTKYDTELAENNKAGHVSYKAYGLLIQGYAVCSGYSDTLSLFLDRYNIPNIRVSSENHIWNLVYVDNKWLHVDLTWDDNDYSKVPKKSFLLITTQRLKELDVDEHTYDTNFFLEAN